MTERLQAIANRIDAFRLKYEKNRDERAVFAFVYHGITEGLLELLRRPDSGFDDPQWVASLAEIFAERYLRAMEGIDGWLESGSRDRKQLYATVTKPWVDVYLAIRNGQSYVLEDLLFSMMTHIAYDLPLALVEAGMEYSAGSHVADHHRLNDVLAHRTDEIQRLAAERYNRFLAVLDQWAGRYDEFFSNYGIRAVRSVAWYNACRLRDPRAARDAQASIERSTQSFIEFVRKPDDRRVRVLVKLARWLIPRRRRWP